jgi:hypothetical protein
VAQPDAEASAIAIAIIPSVAVETFFTAGFR